MSIGQQLGSVLSYQRRCLEDCRHLRRLTRLSDENCFSSTPDTEDPQRKSDDGEMQVLQA